MTRSRLHRVIKHYYPTDRRNHVRPLRDFWIRETGTGQQVAKLHDRYMMMMTMTITVTVGGWRWNFEMNTDSSVTIVTRLRAERQKIDVSIAN